MTVSVLTQTSFGITEIISIKRIETADQHTWHEIWKACDYATFFHSQEWADMWKIYTKGKYLPEPKLITFSDGKKAILPLSKRSKYGGLVSEYFLSPEGGFGGWISADQLDNSHAQVMLDWLLKRFQKDLTWILNPYDELAFQSVSPSLLSDYETYSMNLKQDFERFYSRQSSAFRKVKKAQKTGISIKVASTLNEWKEYHEAYQHSLQRWGDSKHSEGYQWELFEQIFHRQSPNIKLWVATLDNRVISGALCFYAKTHVVYWHGASLEEYFQLRPVNLLMYEIMQACHQQGYLWFDFNPSPGLDGVTAFKKSLGASTLQCPIFVNRTPLYNFASKVEYRLKHLNSKAA